MRHFQVTIGRKTPRYFVVDAPGYFEAAVKAVNALRPKQPAGYAIRLGGRPGLAGTFQAIRYEGTAPRPLGPKVHIQEV